MANNPTGIRILCEAGCKPDMKDTGRSGPLRKFMPIDLLVLSMLQLGF